MNAVVSREPWLEARKALLAREKDFTHARDALNAERRKLPLVKVDKHYGFETAAGMLGLSDLFEGRRQLIIYHFMFHRDRGVGCPGCSHMAGLLELRTSLPCPAVPCHRLKSPRQPLPSSAKDRSSRSRISLQTNRESAGIAAHTGAHLQLTEAGSLEGCACVDRNAERPRGFSTIFLDKYFRQHRAMQIAHRMGDGSLHAWTLSAHNRLHVGT
jgi:hypothetical protein